MSAMPPAEPNTAAIERAAAALRRHLAPERVTTAPEDMVVYSYDGTWVVGRPQIAVTPLDAHEVARAVRVAADEGIPIVPRGAASGLAGGAVPLFGSMVVNMTRMNRILDIDRINIEPNAPQAGKLLRHPVRIADRTVGPVCQDAPLRRAIAAAGEQCLDVDAVLGVPRVQLGQMAHRAQVGLLDDVLRERALSPVENSCSNSSPAPLRRQPRLRPATQATIPHSRLCGQAFS